jgi:hypothetical protein
MTWIEVTDTAVKIGLGALIAAVSAALGARSARKHDLYRDVLKRRQDLLIEITNEFEVVHSNLVEFAGSFGRADNPASQPELRDAALKKISELGPKLDKSLVTLQMADGKLLLIGLPAGAGALADYRTELTHFMTGCREPSFRQRDNILSKIISLNRQRLKFYGWITNDYCGKSGGKFPEEYLPNLPIDTSAK